MKLRLLSPLLLVAVLLAGCGGGGSAPTVSGTDIAVVDNQHVSLSAYNEALAEVRASDKAQGEAFPKAGSSSYQTVQTEVVDTLVQEAEFAIEAQKLHLSVSAKTVDNQIASLIKSEFGGSRAKYLAGLKAQGYTQAEIRNLVYERELELVLFNHVTKGTKVTAAQIQAYYEQNLSQYETPASRQVHEILVGKGKKALAEQIYDELKAGTGTWAALAKKYSQDPSSKDKAGLFTANDGEDVAQFDAAVFATSAKTNVLLKPVNTSQYGWFVIEPISAVKPATTKPESQEAASIRTTLDNQNAQTAFEKWLTTTSKGFCSANEIGYRAGYSPSPNPCTAITTTQATTT
jgi:parvulin-like peptidyl-prolyl isomerase